MKTYSKPRPKVPPATETQILVLSRRRCALCFGIAFDLSEKKGQIGHLDQNHENNKLNNLIWFCLDHHDSYDSSTSQSKGFTQREVTYYREELYKAVNDKKSARGKTDYQYKYFNKISYFIDKEIIDAEDKIFLKKLDEGKRIFYENILNASKIHNIDKSRIQKIDDYLFKIYRDIWFIQKKWKEIKDRYFQGKITMIEIPDYLSDGKVEISGLSNQTDDWKDLGYTEEYAPVQLECHVYEGLSGHGFIVFARVKIKGDIWENKMHIGPELYRDKDNFTWIKLNEEF